ncbi:LuxR C-terminal-related transcriptional regulator [Ancylobacter sp. Lp-2]|uniref:helix-turn-helix transcriptional regulator n=1 Tax=Ancylobacter sp. Lp-2 TaxID=2881339 RepID=UPI001E2993E6|nr:LuxR C-terminal-related transcriptional regulator [Ancylobacter sp. Lp-2]MCB4770391.1 LuxR C-terminal-related transcriptional regulator [Ancylobacter sp. Lp-2]
MPMLNHAITPRGDAAHDMALAQEIVALYEAEPDLIGLPAALFAGVARLIDCEVTTYSEFHHTSGEFRSIMSVEDDPGRRMQAIAAYARHMHSHPFWSYDPGFFGERALRESDFFDEEQFLALPIAREVFLPSNARHLMAIVIQHEDYVLTIAGHRVIGRPPFGNAERERLEAFRPHVLRSYRQAQQRTVAALTPADRLRVAFPELTPRQLEVASWIANGKSNEDIATILGVGVDTVKAHVKAIHAKIGADGRLAIAVIAYTFPPFERRPPLWRIGGDVWAGRHGG